MNRTEIHHRLEMMVSSTGGREYTVTVYGQMRDDGRWEGFLEFAPTAMGIGRVVRTPVQTTQSSVKQLLYWASGLSRTNLENSLMTALYPPPPRPPQPRAEEQRQSLGPDDAELPPQKPSR